MFSESCSKGEHLYFAFEKCFFAQKKFVSLIKKSIFLYCIKNYKVLRLHLFLKITIISNKL